MSRERDVTLQQHRGEKALELRRRPSPTWSGRGSPVDKDGGRGGGAHQGRARVTAEANRASRT